MEKYFEEAFDKAMLENAEYFLRTIPVNQSIDVTHQVATYDDELAQISPDHCIGCGLCVTTCPVEAIQLVAKPDATLRLPPINTAEQMFLMAQKRGII